MGLRPFFTGGGIEVLLNRGPIFIFVLAFSLSGWAAFFTSVPLPELLGGSIPAGVTHHLRNASVHFFFLDQLAPP